MVDAKQRGAKTAPKSSPAPAPGTAIHESHKVLIVEDTTELAEVIAVTLERINMRAFRETHVDRALTVYEAERPDVILLDIGLPDKTGWKLLDAIREGDVTKLPVVVVITAHGDPANRLMGKLQGVQGYLVKPFTTDEVEDVVGKALAMRDRPDEGGQLATAPLPDFVAKLMEGIDRDFDAPSSAAGEGDPRSG